MAVINPVDPAVNNEVFDEITDRWLATGTEIERLEFPATLALPHDIIDPRQPAAMVSPPRHLAPGLT